MTFLFETRQFSRSDKWYVLCTAGKTPLLAIVSSSVAFFDGHKLPKSSMSRIDKLHLLALTARNTTESYVRNSSMGLLDKGTKTHVCILINPSINYSRYRNG